MTSHWKYQGVVEQTARLVLADGRSFEGATLGASGTAVGEVVFTTGATGHQEVLTDPSHAGQMVAMTAAQVGNTGVNEEDLEADQPRLSGFIVQRASSVVSSWRSTGSVHGYLVRHGVVGISGVDTRSLTRHIRGAGAQMGAIGTEDVGTLCDRARSAGSMVGRNLADETSTPVRYTWTRGTQSWGAQHAESHTRHVVVIDFGVKRNILRCLVDLGCRVTVLPSTATADDVAMEKPDGVLLSNGPGDPQAVEIGVETIRALLGTIPLFGICLGHQLLCRALGAKTYKLKYGHHGLNQPVKNLTNGRIEVTAQNHGFCVDSDSMAGVARTTHIHLNDGTCEGVEHVESDAFSVQYHPEAAAGPHDARHYFAQFMERIDAPR